MYWQCYLRVGIVYLPTTAIVSRALYQIVEPVIVAAVGDDDALRLGFTETFARGNPKVAAPDPSDRSPPILTKYAGVKNWSTFVRNASLWGIDQRDGRFDILGYRRDPPNGWVRDKKQDVAFPSSTSGDQVIERMIAILQEADNSAKSN